MIRINGEAFRKSMQAARKRLAKLVMAAVRHAAELARDTARATTLFKDRTGELRRSIKLGPTTSTSARAVATSRHAGWVERGNGPAGAYIFPKRSPFLIFTLDGRKVFAHKVRTASPRPFMADAQAEVTPLFERLCAEAANNMFG